MSEMSALWALFGSAFLSATLLPLPSEGALIAYVSSFPIRLQQAVVVATIGNTLGGITTYLLGRFSRRFLQKNRNYAPQVLEIVKRFGPAALLFSWLPVFGDLLCAFAGWLNLSVWRCFFWMGIGKGLRYLAVVGVFFKFENLGV